MSEISLNLITRDKAGTRNSKRLRRKGRIPGVFYFHGSKPIVFHADGKEAAELLGRSTSLINLTIDGKEKKQGIVREIQFDPLDHSMLHIDLMGIKLSEKINVAVPVHFIGVSQGVKEGGILQQLVREIQVECLPTNIPSQIEIDVTNLGIGQHVSAGDIDIENVKVLDDATMAIVSVIPPRVVEIAEEVVEEKVEEGEAEPEVISKRAEEEHE
jgi:large subunit ribosomal protein L25